MSLPIKETPVLTGKDAVRFLERMHEAETRPITKKEQEDFERAYKTYIKLKHSHMKHVLQKIIDRLSKDDLEMEELFKRRPEIVKVIEEEFWDVASF